MELLTIDGKKYALNLTKICDFIHKEGGKGTKETEIIDSFDFKSEGSKEINGKTVRELNLNSNGQEPVVYDLIKMLIVQIIAYDFVGDIDLNDLPFGTKIAFNTLINEGFLIERK